MGYVPRAIDEPRRPEERPKVAAARPDRMCDVLRDASSPRLLAICAVLALVAIGPTLFLPPVAIAAESSAVLLRLASDRWPPFTAEEGAARVAIRLVEGALDRTGRRSASTIVESGFDDVMERIRQGEFDGSPALWKTPEREAFLHFSAPYLENRLVLVGREGSPVEVQSIAELAGKRVATVGAYAYGGILESAVGPELVPGESDAANLRKLLDGGVDYVLVDELLIHHLVRGREARAEAALEIGRYPLVSRPLHFALRKDVDGAEQIVEAFDREIRAMMADGTYHRTLDVDWLWADIDDDGRSELVLGGIQAGASEPSRGYDVLAGERAAPHEETDSRYAVEGVVYEEWEHIPDRYKVEIDRTRQPLEPGVTLIRF